MARAIDEGRQREICAIIAVGGSRRTAAKYVGCSPDSIRRRADRDPEFAKRLKRAESDFEVIHLSNIQQAGKKSWNASAWMLERVHPERFGKRTPGTITFQELGEMLEQFTAMIEKEVDNPQTVQRLINRLDRLVLKLTTEPKRKARK